MPPSRACAASGTSRARRARRPRRGPARPARWPIRLAPRLRPARALRPTVRPPDPVVASRRGGALARDFPARRSSSTTRGCRRTAAPMVSRAGAGDGNARRRAQRAGQDLGARPARPPWTVEANGPIVRDTIAIFGLDRCMFASNFPVDCLCAASTRSSPASRRSSPTCATPTAQAVPRQRGTDLSPVRLTHDAPPPSDAVRPRSRRPRLRQDHPRPSLRAQRSNPRGAGPDWIASSLGSSQ